MCIRDRLYFIRLHVCINRAVPTYLLEHYDYSAITPHALRARAVIVHRYMLVLARAHILCIIFIEFLHT